jgi:hypothetical protein
MIESTRIECASPETKIIQFEGRPWRVSRFHFVVGAIDSRDWNRVQVCLPPATADCCWFSGLVVLVEADFVYVNAWTEHVAQWRARQTPFDWFLGFTNNPLVVNELQPEECTLACHEDDQLILTNFADLPNIETAMKIYQLGEFWLSYATGGAERPLRKGESR